jgi:hypothetical protein
MLGRKNYSREELDSCRAAIGEQVDAYRRLTAAVRSASDGKAADQTLAGFEGRFFTNMVLVLDRYFVHRVRAVSGKDGNPLNEVELIADGVMMNGGVLPESSVIKYASGKSVLGLEIGGEISLTLQDFERLSAAFLAEIEQRFV